MSDPCRDELVKAWLRVVAATAYVPRTSTEIAADLAEMVDALYDALHADPFDPDAGTPVGERMVADGLIGMDTLRRTVATLAKALLDIGAPERVAVLLSAVSGGYAAALRERTLTQQENMKVALHRAMRQAERDRKATESIFREVFTGSAAGIAITELDGRFVETNPALAAILACEPAELAGRSLAEFLTPDHEHPDPLNQLPDRQALRRDNGETAWVFSTTSMLRDEHGAPQYRVTMVHDLSELQLLQDRLSHQLLHDAVTGVANRVRFESRLESMHGTAQGALTLLCLDVDAFSMINTTHGHAAGDRMLRTVAERLKTVVAQENAVVARLGSDEFAILIQDGPDTPPVADLVDEINLELAEPAYHGGVGIAVSVSIGAVRAEPSRMSSAELFRAGDQALRQARRAGRRQWTEFDPDADRVTRAADLAATALPAAWENGELDIAYDIVVRLSDRVPVRVAAVAHAPRPRGGAALPATVDLAESTGLSMALAPWMVSRSTEQVPVWQGLFAAAPARRLLLTPLQSAHSELSAALNQAITDCGIAPGLLEVGLDAATVLRGGDAQDNLRTIGDIGVVTALHEFTGGPREIAVVERFRVASVVLADPFDGWRPDWLPHDCVQIRVVREMIATLRSLGASVGVRGVRDLAEARWWAALDVDTAEGAVFGRALDVEDVLARVRSAK